MTELGLRERSLRGTKPRFIEIRRERRTTVPFSEEQLTAMRGGLTAEEYRWKLIRETDGRTRGVTRKRKDKLPSASFSR